MEYKFEGNTIPKEEWYWIAQYQDGSTLKQFDDNGFYHQFMEIDQSQLKVFKMVSDNHSNIFTLIFTEEMKLIHFYKRFMLDIGTEQYREISCYCFGYEIKGQKMMVMITPSNEIIITNNTNLIQIE